MLICGSYCYLGPPRAIELKQQSSFTLNSDSLFKFEKSRVLDTTCLVKNRQLVCQALSQAQHNIIEKRFFTESNLHEGETDQNIYYTYRIPWQKSTFMPLLSVLRQLGHSYIRTNQRQFIIIRNTQLPTQTVYSYC